MVAYLAACRLQPVAVSSYYGGAVPKYLDERPQCPVMFHYGSADAGIPAQNVAQVSAARPESVVHVHEGAGHGFSCDARESFHPQHAALARTRTLALFEAAHTG